MGKHLHHCFTVKIIKRGQKTSARVNTQLYLSIEEREPYQPMRTISEGESGHALLRFTSSVTIPQTAPPVKHLLKKIKKLSVPLLTAVDLSAIIPVLHTNMLMWLNGRAVHS